MKKLSILFLVLIPLLVLAQPSNKKIVDNGGSGPFKAIAIAEQSLPDFVVYRPDDINKAAKAEGLLPILVWANGGCMNSSIHHERFLTELASHGYIIVAIGHLQMTVEERVHQHTSDTKLLEAIDWITAQANDKQSAYHNKVDLNKIAAAGHSCGGAQTLRVAADSRIKTYMMFNAGMGNMTMAGASTKSLDELHGRIIYIVGGESDIATNNAFMDYDRIDKVPVVFANLLKGGHGGTFAEEFGGSYSRITRDWLDWQFKGKDKSDVFLKGDLSNYPGWTVKSKNFTEISEKNIQRVDSLLQSFIDNNKANCLTAYVAKGGNVIYKKAFGYKDIENQIPATIDDIYVLFSQTKAITTVAFMTLVEKGLVDVNDPVSKYFPEISNEVVTKVNDDGTYETRPASTPVTFAHLMSHSSGLGAGEVGKIRRIERMKAESANGGQSNNPGGQRSYDGNPNSRVLGDEMKSLAKYPLGFDPGSEWNYHVSTNMLAYMVELISGKTLREYVKETILEPLDMNSTDWYFEPEYLSRFVKPYTYVDGRLEPGTMMFAQNAVGSEQSYCEGAIGLNGPIDDYARFCQMLLNKGELNNVRILKPETVELMTTTNLLPEKNSGGKGFQFGMGFELYNELKKPTPAVSNTAYAWGGMLGTEYIIDPENDLVVLFYLNVFRRDALYPLFLKEVYQQFVSQSEKE